MCCLKLLMVRGILDGRRTADNLEEQAMCRVSLKVWVGARKMFGAFIPKMKFVGSK